VTRKHKSGVTFPRKDIVVICAIAAAVIVAAVAFEWRLITNSNSDQENEVFSDLPDVDLSALQANSRDRLVRRANVEKCPCNCGLTLARCRNRDRSCQTSLKIARETVKQAKDGGP
jgi:hypothetical protein